MEIRIQRTVSVQPKFIRSFIGAAIDVTAHSTKVMGVGTDVFYNVYHRSENAEFRFFSDFQSMAQYRTSFSGSCSRIPSTSTWPQKQST